MCNMGGSRRPDTPPNGLAVRPADGDDAMVPLFLPSKDPEPMGSHLNPRRFRSHKKQGTWTDHGRGDFQRLFKRSSGEKQVPKVTPTCVVRDSECRGPDILSAPNRGHSWRLHLEQGEVSVGDTGLEPVTSAL